MKNSILYLLTFFTALSLFAQEPAVKFYLNDGSFKSYFISDIDNIGIITGKNNYVMKIFYQDTLTAYYPTATIDSMAFSKDTANKNLLNVFIFGMPRIFTTQEIDSITFNQIEPKLSDKVIVIDTIKSKEINSLDSLNINFNKTSTVGINLKVGDIIASEPTKIAPKGFLRRVKSINMQGDNIIIETENAKLTDVIENGVISFKRKFTPADTGKISVKAYNDNKILSDEGFTVGFKDIVVYDNDGNMTTTNDQIKIDGSETFNPEIGFNLVIENWKVKQTLVQLCIENNLKLEAHANLEYEKEIKKSINDLLGIPPFKLPPVTIPVGWLPVVITSDIDIQVGLNLKIGAEIRTGITNSSSAICGFEFNNGNWKPLKETKNNFTYDPPELSLGGTFKAFVGPQLNINLYDQKKAFNAYANVLGFVELEVDFLDKPLWQLWAGVEGNTGVESDWFDFHKELPLVLEYRKLLAQSDDLIKSVSPKYGKVGDIIIIKGKGFKDVRGSGYVGFKAGKSLLDVYQATEYPKWSDEEIQVKIPNGLSVGEVKLILKVAGFLSNMADFIISDASSPKITNVSVESATIYTPITITGSDFGDTQGNGFVSFGGVKTTNPASTWTDKELNHYGLKSIGLTMNKFFIPI